MSDIDVRDLYRWCKIQASELVRHPELKIPFRIVKDSEEMGEVMAKDFLDEIKAANLEGRPIRAIVPCKKGWHNLSFHHLSFFLR